MSLYPRFLVSVSVSTLAAVFVVVLSAGVSFAGKDHCRTLVLDGSAGDTSTDSVTFQIVDENGGTIIDQSCQVTVQSSEEAADLGARLPIQWYLDDPTLAASPCPTDAEALARATKPSGKIKYPKKGCTESSGPAGPSCKLKFTYKVKKSTGEVKKGPSLEVCCFEGPECKGTKWGTTTANPVNLQVRNNNVSIDFLPTPASLPAVVGATSDLVVDPIGIGQLPVPEVNVCRAELASDVEQLTNFITNVLGDCHLAPGVADHAVCNTVSPASNPSGSVAAAVTALRTQVRDACAALGSPSKFSFTECPNPCAGQITPPTCLGGPSNALTCRLDSDCDSPSLCVEGNVGPACATDGDCDGFGDEICLGSGFCAGSTCTTNAECDAAPGTGKCLRRGDGICKDRCVLPAINAGDPCGADDECDSAPSSGDGRCGDWGEVGDCASCLTRASVENTMLTTFGPAGAPLPGLTPGGLLCKQYLVGASAKLQKAQIKETNSCQKSLDAGKIALPDTAKKCKDADRKGKRQKALLQFQNPLFAGKACQGISAAEIGGCGATASELASCVADSVRDVNEHFAIAAYPDLRCGDAKRIGEDCDDGNLLNGDGCADDCTCEGVCGDGVVNPLAVCGEFCDDGNTTSGDGCESNCTISPTCGNGTVDPLEQCEIASDCAAGETCSICRCEAPKTIFVTSQEFNGNLGGLAGADTLCQNLAAPAGLNGTYKAWLSDSTATAAARLTHSSTPYVRTDGVPVATDWADLTDGTLLAPIDADENAGPGGGGTAVWTASDTSGFLTPNVSSTCADWTDSTPAAGDATIGLRNWSTGNWTDCVATGSCAPNLCSGISQHLYCVEQ